MNNQEKREGIAYKILRIFTEVHPGEVPTALLLTLNVFLLLMAYYLIKPVREVLILVGKDPQTKSYLAGAQAILLIFVIKAFSYLASKFPRHLLITWVTLFFISNLGIFYIFHLFGMPMGTIGIIFFIWTGIFNIFIVAQFWGFANDIYTDEAGKRLFPLVAFGQTSGALFGAKIANLIIEPLGKDFAYKMMLITAGLLGVCILMTLIIHKREIKLIHGKSEHVEKEITQEEKMKEQPLKKVGGFRLIFKSQYLLFYAFVILSLNFVNATGEYIWSDALTQTAKKAVQMGTTAGLNVEQFVGKLSADYQFIASLVALILQLFLVSRIFKWVGVSGALLFLPIIALGGYSSITFGVASLVLIKWVKGMENGTDYSIMNTTKGALFLITSREEKYKAKAAADTFFYRGGDALSALTVFIGFKLLGFPLQSFAKLNVVVVLIWIFLCILVIREYKKLKAKMAITGAAQTF